jgi:hypothetical protein
MNLELDISDFEHLWHTGCNIDVPSVIDDESYSWVKGDKLEVFEFEFRNEIKLGMYHVGESYLEALAGLQILRTEGYKAGLFWDDAPITEDAQSLTYWGYVIFTDMTLEFDEEVA